MMQDRVYRDIFVNDISRNFSVIAPAGVGKTRAIVDRIVHIARTEVNGSSRLSDLVVVTYTKKAALEMHERALKSIQSDSFSFQKMDAFNQAFFGTIHSFCLQLIQEHGFILGISPKCEVVQDEEDLWRNFTQEIDQWNAFLPEDSIREISKYIQLSDYIDIARGLNINDRVDDFTLDAVNFEGQAILQFKADKRNQKNVEEAKSILKKWIESVSKENTYCGIVDFNKGGQDFKDTWVETFLPFKNAVSKHLYLFLNNIAKAYRAFRLKKGQLLYDDLVYCVKELVRNDVTKKILSKKKYNIILDEAQDTDAEQFEVLLSLAGLWDGQTQCLLSNDNGRFCMLGDPQQAIYGQRANVQYYESLHNDFEKKGAGTCITFDVTMRCDREIVYAVNQFFPNILKKQKLGQVGFVHLIPRPEAQKGEVFKAVPPLCIENNQEITLVRSEAEYIASLFSNQVLEKWKIDDWSQVAFLAPRRQWLLELAEVFSQKNIPFQVHSPSQGFEDSPSVLWIESLLTIFAFPTDSFELVGVLREIYGLADDAIARYIQSKGLKKELHALNLLEKNDSDNEVAQTLNLLIEIRNQIQSLSLRLALEKMMELTDLRARIQCLPHDKEKLLLDIDAVLFQATQCEKEGLSLYDFTLTYRQHIAKINQEEKSLQGHIQLYTCHKAKGLEFDIVFLPFLFRKIGNVSPVYPRVIGTNYQERLILDKTQYSQEDKEWDISHSYSELERLLYVSMTRSKKRLILVDDSLIFENQEPSFGNFLNLAQPSNKNYWNDLPLLEIPVAKEEAVPVSSDDILDIKNLNSFINKEIASKYSHQIFTKKVPSALLAPSLISSKDAVYGAAYGRLWHEAMHMQPWLLNTSNSIIENYYKNQVFGKRFKKELDILKSSELWSILKKTGVKSTTEFPFFWKNESRVYDGMIDLMIYDPPIYLIIDWKTHSLDSHSMDVLLEMHTPQLKVYTQAVSQLYECFVSSYIYFTENGLFKKVCDYNHLDE